MDPLLILLGTIFGFALCWFTKDNVISMISGTEGLIKNLEAKSAALRASLRAKL